MTSLQLDWNIIKKLEGEQLLAKFIAEACGIDKHKAFIAQEARRDFKWSAGDLMPYVQTNQLAAESYRASHTDPLYFLSSGEWLCALFNCGPRLSNEHIRLLMAYINPYVDISNTSQYMSCKDVWENVAPSSLCYVLTLLDVAAVANVGVEIIDQRIRD